MLSVRGLNTQYPGEGGHVVRAARDVAFEVPEGKLFTLLGPSGCGKTTTLRSIAGLERPHSGEIALGGHTLYSSAGRIFVAPNERNIGMVFQSYAIWPHMTVYRNAAFPLEVGHRGLSAKEIRDKVMRVLAIVAMDGLAERPATNLSGGQQQRSEEHTSELQSLRHLVCRLLLEKKKNNQDNTLLQQQNNTTQPISTTTRQNTSHPATNKHAPRTPYTLRSTRTLHAHRVYNHNVS